MMITPVSDRWSRWTLGWVGMGCLGLALVVQPVVITVEAANHFDEPGTHDVHVRDVAIPRSAQMARADNKQLTPDAIAAPDMRIFYPTSAAIEPPARPRVGLLRPLCTPAGCVSPNTVGSAASVPILQRVGSVFGFRSRSEDADEDTTLPSSPQPHALVAFVHPLYGSTMEQWVSRNDAFLRHLASHGYVVITSLWIPGECGLAGVSAVDGVTQCSGLPPGNYPLDMYLRSARHMQRAIQYVNRGNVPWLKRNEGGAAFPAVGVVGYSVGGALAAWLAERGHLQPFMSTPIDAVVALAPTVGRPQGNGARNLFVNASNSVPHLIIVGSNDNMGGRDGTKVLYQELRKAPRVAVELSSSTHCFVPYPLASECGLRSGQQQRAARHHTVAFLDNYLKRDSTRGNLVWGDDLLRAPGAEVASVGRNPSMSVQLEDRDIQLQPGESRSILSQVLSTSAPPPAGWSITLAVAPLGRRLPLDVTIDARVRHADDVGDGKDSITIFSRPGGFILDLSAPPEARQGLSQRVMIKVQSEGTVARQTVAVRVI